MISSRPGAARVWRSVPNGQHDCHHPNYPIATSSSATSCLIRRTAGTRMMSITMPSPGFMIIYMIAAPEMPLFHPISLHPVRGHRSCPNQVYLASFWPNSIPHPCFVNDFSSSFPVTRLAHQISSLRARIPRAGKYPVHEK